MGDRAIREVASLVAATGEIVGRLGGEEFAMLLPGRDLEGGRAIAERMREEIMAVRLPLADKIVVFTSSFGVSEWKPGESVDDMLRRADMALYSAKAQGRNRVIAAGDEAPAPDDYEDAGRPLRGAQREHISAVPRSAA
jgi:diguanylate cyclase (GGDEF)-like protein